MVVDFRTGQSRAVNQTIRAVYLPSVLSFCFLACCISVTTTTTSNNTERCDRHAAPATRGTRGS